MRQQLAARTPNTILVVEDEILIQMCTADYLRDCGYQVFEACTVDEAIAVLDAEANIDIVFTDVHMPGGRDGFDLTRWAAIHRPEIKIILTSGGANAADLAVDLCHEGPLISKPYHPRDVSTRIHAVLHSAVDHNSTASSTLAYQSKPVINADGIGNQS